jgi:hypothetical protein
MSIAITQGDYVLYQDTSIGNPTGRAWNFPGGTPTGATATNPIVRYLSPNSSGYNVKLTVTKSAISSFKEETKIIVVNPENISVTLRSNATSPSVNMGTTVIYTAVGSTGNLSYYSWTLAGIAGFTGTAQTQSTTLYSWINLTGSESGSAYSTYTSESKVIFNSVLGNTSSSSTSVTYSKNGGFEPYNYLADSYTPGTQYYEVGPMGILAGAIGMAGAGQIFRVNTNFASVLPIDNTQFRAQGETVNYWSSSQDIEFAPGVPGNFPGQFVASSAAFKAMGVTQTGWGSLSRYATGNYMIPGDLGTYFGFTFYFTDLYAYQKNLEDTRNWTSRQVFNLVFSDTSVGYQSSRSLELAKTAGATPAAFILGFDGAAGLSGGRGGACLPSALYTSTATVELYLTLKYSSGGSIDEIEPGLDIVIPVIVSDAGITGGQGNCPDGTLMVAQDTVAGVGIATLINDAISNAGYSSYVGASASPSYAWLYNSGAYDVNAFNGLSISILDRGSSPPYLVAVDLSDNGPWLTFPYNGFPTSPGISNWLSFNSNRVANPYQLFDISYNMPVRGWYFGNP